MNEKDKQYLEDNKNISTSEVLQDIKDTEEEIKGYEILSKSEPHTRRMNDMKISSRREFIGKIQRIINLRKELSPTTGSEKE